MADPNIDKALAYLGSSISSLIDASKEPVDYKLIPKKIPNRSLTGDHITGGKITNFSSSGIVDSATEVKLTINNEQVTIDNLSVNTITSDLVITGNVSARKLSADIIEAKTILGDVEYGKNESIKFSGDSVYGQGLLWSTGKSNKQLVLRENPDRFFFSESIELAKDKSITVNGVDVINSTSLGNSVTKSNLRELGRLKGLIVDGSASISQYFVFDGVSNRLGIGTEEPKKTISIFEENTEIVIGSNGHSRGSIGTYNYTDFDILTDNSTRMSIKSNGDIELGARNATPVKISVLGTLSVNVNTPDSRSDLHVNGGIKFGGNLHLSLDNPPQSGDFSIGDIVWNSSPRIGKSVGWVCTRSGNPGTWNPFGDIKERSQ